jgi:hypothetical protein
VSSASFSLMLYGTLMACPDHTVKMPIKRRTAASIIKNTDVQPLKAVTLGRTEQGTAAEQEQQQQQADAVSKHVMFVVSRAEVIWQLRKSL